MIPLGVRSNTFSTAFMMVVSGTEFVPNVSTFTDTGLAIARPVSVNVDTFGTNSVPETTIMKAVEKVFDLTPKGIIEALDLRRPIYSKTSSYGHFGRQSEKNPTGKGTLFTWERLDRVSDLKKAVKGV